MPEDTQAPRGQNTFSGCLARFVWMAVGNAALVLLVVMIAQRGTMSFTVLDLVFWLVPVIVIATRYLDVSRLGGQTVDGDPATLGHWRRHAIGLALISVALWLAAHGLAATGWLK